MLKFSRPVRVLMRAALLVPFLLGGVRVAMAAEPRLATLSESEVVTPSDFEAYLARRVDLKPLARNFWGAESALKEMLMTRALVLEGLRLKEPNRNSEQPERFDDIYGAAIYKKLVATCPSSVDDKSARSFYDKHPEVFTTPATARLARVMLPVADKVDGMPSMAWLMEQAEAVAKGASDFNALASKTAGLYKLEPQGDLGWVNLTGDVAIMRALMAAKSGEMVGPVRDGDFAYLFLLGEKREPRLLKWDEVKTTAAARQVRYCREQANNELREKLFKKYNVSIDENAVKALFKISSPTKPGAEPKK